MILIRNIFIARPGCASKLAAQLRTASGIAGMPKARVLTDITGDFNRVVLEFEAASVEEFGQHMHDYATNEAVREAMKGYTDLWITGSRELLQVT